MNADLLVRLASMASKKFVIAIVALILVVFFVDVPGSEKLNIITWLVGIYAGANVGQKAVTDLKDGK